MIKLVKHYKYSNHLKTQLEILNRKLIQEKNLKSHYLKPSFWKKINNIRMLFKY